MERLVEEHGAASIKTTHGSSEGTFFRSISTSIENEPVSTCSNESCGMPYRNLCIGVNQEGMEKEEND